MNALFLHNDPLVNLLYSQNGNDATATSFNGEELDINYRAALEVTRSGELRVAFPIENFLETEYNPLHIVKPVPDKCAKEVQTVFSQLEADLQHQHAAGSSLLLVVSIVYELSSPTCGWSFSRDGKSCFSSHGAMQGSMHDGMDESIPYEMI